MVFKRSVDEIEMISKSCQIVADTIDMITEFVVPGCLVSDLDKKAENYIKLTPLNIWYRFIFEDGMKFDYSGNEDQMKKQIEKISKEDDMILSSDELIEQHVEVPLKSIGRRLDQVAAELFPDFSRSRLKLWITQGHLHVDGHQQVPKMKLLGGETLSLCVQLEAQGDWKPEDIPLDIIFEDEHILVLNKSANFVVHPAAGNYSGTVLNALLFHCPELASVPRAGIVHRLDKDTTGLMVVAKTLQAHTDLVAQLQARTCLLYTSPSPRDRG